jgi:hypothetical protein
MAAIKQAPVLANALVAREAFEADLPRVLKGRGAASVEEAGWTRLADLELLVPVQARSEKELIPFFLRLKFYHYPEWPPSAQFVNPATRTFDLEKDRYWLPKILGTDEVRVHDHVKEAGGQLICCSATLEFYIMLHDVKPEHLWDHSKYTFAHTINQIEWGLAKFYQGRFGEAAV